MAQSHREASRRLFEVAEPQQGFFTTKQAKAAGFAENTHPYHVQVGNWIREHRGIYRLALFPMADRPDLVLSHLVGQDSSSSLTRQNKFCPALAVRGSQEADTAHFMRSASNSFSGNWNPGRTLPPSSD